jgi:hypothetical protein
LETSGNTIDACLEQTKKSLLNFRGLFSYQSILICVLDWQVESDSQLSRTLKIVVEYCSVPNFATQLSKLKESALPLEVSMEDLDEDLAQTDGLPKGVKILAGIALVSVVGFVSFVATQFATPDPRIAQGERLWEERDPDGQDDHDTLFFVSETLALDPKMVSLSELPDDDLASRSIIGIEVDGISHAYILHEVAEKKNVYMVSTRVNGRPIAFVHNYQKDQTRVLTKEDYGQVLDFRLGGAEYMKNIAVLYDDVRYRQDSEKLPLDDYPYTRTTLDRWVEEHPDTLINFDEELSERDFYER